MSPRRSSRPEVLAAGPAGDLRIPGRSDAAVAIKEPPAAAASDTTAADCAGSPACCPRLHEAVELVGKRWSGAIVYVLLEGGSMRFSEIGGAVPNLSDRLLSERMKELEARGIVEREVREGSPARVEYSLTEMGRELAPALRELREWALRYL
jgi:DNA-binding HxlR family transcriptional regulator